MDESRNNPNDENGKSCVGGKGKTRWKELTLAEKN